MGRRPKDIDRSGLWHEKVVADFIGRHPQGMYRPVEIEADPELRIEALPWWEKRPALMLFGCGDAGWDEAGLLIWAQALAIAAEARGAILEIACGVETAAAAVDYCKLGPEFRHRRGVGTGLGQAEAYVHLVRSPGEDDRPPPLTVSEMLSTLGG